MYYKLQHSDADILEVDFLKKKVSLPYSMGPVRQSDCGIPLEKKADILNKLVPLMPPNHAAF